MIKLDFLYKNLCSCDVIFEIKYPRAESEGLHSYPLPLIWSLIFAQIAPPPLPNFFLPILQENQT